ncbi:hypothetical protein [Streptomyces sp. NPDC055036]
MNLTREHMTALLAVFVAVLAGVIFLYAGAGLGSVLGAALIGYVGTVFGVACKVQLHLPKVITSTTRGSVIVVVVIVLVLLGIYRSVRGL